MITCALGCPPISVTGGGRVFYEGTPFLFGANPFYSAGVIATCGTNFNSFSTCQKDQSWSPNALDCAASACGTMDPHFELTGLATNETFTFDFHGKSQMSYCLVTDSRLALNVRMFGLAPNTKILERRRAEDDDPFFEGTWMDAMGIMYADVSGNVHDVSIVMDPDLDRAGRPSLFVAFQGEAIAELNAEPEATWTSPDGATSITRHFRNGSDSVKVVIAGVLDVDIVTSREQELIANPPIHFLNFFIKSMAVGPSVHGFLGQMYAPGAVEARLAMGTLEGLHHREYVEGADDDYVTSALTSSDCTFNRFLRASDDGGGPFDVSADMGSSASRMSNTGPQRRLRALGAVRPLPALARCRRLDNRNAFVCAVGEP